LSEAPGGGIGAVPGGEAAPPLIGRVVALINARDAEALAPLLDPDVELMTGRRAWRGADEFAVWLARGYDHLERRWVIDELEHVGRGWLARSRVQYLWSEDGTVGDESPLWLTFEVAGGRLRALHLCEDAAAGRAALGS
jgi:hypothetical protein